MFRLETYRMYQIFSRGWLFFCVFFFSIEETEIVLRCARNKDIIKNGRGQNTATVERCYQTADRGLQAADYQYCLRPHNKATRSKILLVIAQPTCLPDFISIMLSAFCNASQIWNRDFFAMLPLSNTVEVNCLKKTKHTYFYLHKKFIILLNHWSLALKSWT